jgi:hypothetical protein
MSPNTRGVLVVLFDCREGADEAALNRWYDEVHIPDVVATGAFFRGTKLLNAARKPGEQKYMAIFETDRPPQEAWNLLSATTEERRKAGRLSADQVNAKVMLYEVARPR